MPHRLKTNAQPRSQPHILGIGTALPAHSVSQDLSARVACRLGCRTGEEGRRLRLLYQKTRVKRRYSVFEVADPKKGVSEFERFFREEGGLGPTTASRMKRYDAEAPRLGERAARRALSSSSIPASRITHLVTVSCTGFAAPGLDIALVGRLGLKRSVARAHVGFMGCHGMFNALLIAKAFSAQDPAARVLVTSVELCSLHYALAGGADRRVANALFADGASAAVVGQGPGLFQIIDFASRVIPDSLDAMSWTIGDRGFEMGLSARIPKLIHEELKGWIESWFLDLGITPEQIRGWAVHPGGPKILYSAREALGIPEKKIRWSYEILRDYGNMSSATLLFILQKMLKAQVRGRVAGIGFGPGLTAEGILLDAGESKNLLGP